MTSIHIEALGDFAPGPIQGTEFTKLAGSDHALPAAPRFTFGPFPVRQMTNYYNTRDIGSVGVFNLQGFTLSGIFLLQSGGIYYRCPELNIHEAHIQAESKRISPFAANIEIKYFRERLVLLSGPGHSVYGHWLVEYLPKLSLLKFAGYDIYDLRYLLPVATPSYVLKWLELLGISIGQIVFYEDTTDVIHAEELIAPTILHNGVRMSPLFRDAAAFLRSMAKVEPNPQPINTKGRIFLARPKGSHTRALTNRARIEELVSNAGFSLIYPEALSLSEQLSLFAGAREIIGEYGSALHGSMFSPEGTVVCALRGTGDHPGFIQSGIGTVMNQPTGYVFGDADDTRANFGFRIDEQALTTALRLVFSAGARL